jgi:hypothetical protein
MFAMSLQSCFFLITFFIIGRWVGSAGGLTGWSGGSVGAAGPVDLIETETQGLGAIHTN